jgi:thymidylate synthase
MVDFLDDGGSVNQIERVICALNHRRPDGGRYADPGPIILERPATAAPAHIGFPCLSLVQFHRFEESLTATATYRSHYYHLKAYGNFVGLGRLVSLVARETGLTAGELTVISTDARVESVLRLRRFLGDVRS